MCNAQDGPAFIKAEKEYLVLGDAVTEDGKAGQSPSFNLYVKRSARLVHTKTETFTVNKMLGTPILKFYHENHSNP